MPIIRKTDEDYLDEPDDQQDQLKGEEGDDDSSVGLLPKAILMGKSANVGDKVVLEITAIHDDQIAVKYPGEEAPEKPEGEEEMPPEKMPMKGEMTPPEAEPAPDEDYG